MMIMMIWLLPSRLSSSIVTKFLSQLADYTHGAHGHPRCPVITPTNPPTAGIYQNRRLQLRVEELQRRSDDASVCEKGVGGETVAGNYGLPSY